MGCNSPWVDAWGLQFARMIFSLCRCEPSSAKRAWKSKPGLFIANTWRESTEVRETHVNMPVPSLEEISSGPWDEDSSCAIKAIRRKSCSHVGLQEPCGVLWNGGGEVAFMMQHHNLNETKWLYPSQNDRCGRAGLFIHFGFSNRVSCIGAHF